MKKNHTYLPGHNPSFRARFPSLLFQRIALFMVMSFCLTTSMYAQSLTYNSSGTFIVPPGVTSITVQAWGAGAGGAGGSSANRSGGGGGAFATNTFAVVPGASYTVTVGNGGGPGVNGGNSSFGIAVIAVGGSTGTGLVGGIGGATARAER